MTIYVVSEENHGEILYAASEEAAKRALLDADWVNSGTDVWIRSKEEKYGGYYDSLWGLYGENWKKEFMEMDKSTLNNMGFYIDTHTVWE